MPLGAGAVDRNVAVYPDGFYDHVESRPMSAIDVVMEMRECSNGEAVEWLRPWIHIEEPEVIHFDFGTRERVEEPPARAVNRHKWRRERGNVQVRAVVGFRHCLQPGR